MPAKEKYDLLVELKETRKMNSWGKLHTLPKKSDNFSDFQMQRLLKRRKIQECLEETEKEIGDGSMSLNELESLLNEEGIDTKIESLPTRRIAANNTTRFILLSNVKEAIAEAKKNQELVEKKYNLEQQKIVEQKTDTVVTEEDDELQKAIKMSLECVDEANTSVATKTDESWTSFLSDSDYSNSFSENDESFEQPDMSSAKAYIMQYSDFTNSAINNIVGSKTIGNKKKIKGPKVDDIIEELQNEKSVIVDKINLSSDEDEVPTEKIEVSESSARNCNNFNINKGKTVIVDKLDLSSDEDEALDESLKPSEVNTTNESICNDEVVNATQQSVIYVENQSRNVIELESSTEDESFKKEGPNDILISESETSSKQQTEEVSTDSELEEVPEEDCKPKSPVVQLTLNVGEAPDDDIFADVFEKKVLDTSSDHEAIIQIESSTNAPDVKIKTEPIVEECVVIKINKDESNAAAEEKTQHSDKVDESTSNLLVPLRSENSNDSKQHDLKTSSEKSIAKDIVDEVTENQVISGKDEKLGSNENIKSNHTPKKLLSSDDLNSMMTEMQTNENDLLQEKGRLDRIGRNISEEMTKEAQELLQIFGIPYIVAPTEAEAQCAFLESVKLTDGTITDDSDIWLFGGRTVYKNFFNQKKHVMQFLSERIEKSFNLTREQLILLALLVGSDYTTGVSGVGPVTALEILASFPFNKKQLLNETSKQAQYSQIITGLQEFKRWVRAGKRTDNTSLKKKLKNVQLTDDFPSLRVVQAYLDPRIEKSEEKFTWGNIDITILRDYARQKFGWSQNKLDEIIKPVLSRIAERKTQKSVQDYFKKKIEFQSLEDQMSKRVKAAVQKMGPENATEENKVQNLEPKIKKKRKANKQKVQESSDVPNLGEPSSSKKIKSTKSGLVTHAVKVNETDVKGFDIIIPKTDRFQEVIPQREKDKQHLLQNKMKAIEIFRKTKIDKKSKRTKRRTRAPKENADLSESSDEN